MRYVVKVELKKEIIKHFLQARMVEVHLMPQPENLPSAPGLVFLPLPCHPHLDLLLLICFMQLS